jgi:hypothetical protein
MKMGVMYKLDRTGHGEVATWGEDAEDRAAGATAFQSLVDQKFTMFDVTDPHAGRKLDTFDPEAKEIIAVPRMQAG